MPHSKYEGAYVLSRVNVHAYEVTCTVDDLLQSALTVIQCNLYLLVSLM